MVFVQCIWYGSQYYLDFSDDRLIHDNGISSFLTRYLHSTYIWIFMMIHFWYGLCLKITIYDYEALVIYNTLFIMVAHMIWINYENRDTRGNGRHKGLIYLMIIWCWKGFSYVAYILSIYGIWLSSFIWCVLLLLVLLGIIHIDSIFIMPFIIYVCVKTIFLLSKPIK